ncbi:MAG: CvpA family protein [Planctomycetota bacterium]|jgi:membrane protein required for colicin V production
MLMEQLTIGEATNWVDVIALLFLVLAIVYGVVRGFMLQLFGIVVLAGAVILACVLSGPGGAWLAGVWDLPRPQMSLYIVFIFVFLLSLLIGMFIARRVQGILAKAKVLAYDRALGGALGCIKGLLLIVVLINLLGYFVLPPEQGVAEGASADVLESQTMGVSKWTTDKVLVFFPDDMRSWLEEKSILRKEEPTPAGKPAPEGEAAPEGKADPEGKAAPDEGPAPEGKNE